MNEGRLLVFGSRTFNDATRMERCLTAALDRLTAKGVAITAVISGCATGADRLGEEWAARHGIAVMRFPADWNGLGRKAGPVRNQQMLDEGRPTHAVGFWKNASPGTADMIIRLEKATIPTWIIEA